MISTSVVIIAHYRMSFCFFINTIFTRFILIKHYSKSFKVLYIRCTFPSQNKNISREDIVYSFKTQIVLVTSNGNFFVDKKIFLNTINDLSLLTPPLNSAVRKVLKTFFDKLSLPIKSSMDLDHSESVKRALLENSNYYGLLSSITIGDELKIGKLRIVQTEPSLPYVEYVILKREEKSKQPLINNLLNYFISNLNNFIPENY